MAREEVGWWPSTWTWGNSSCVSQSCQDKEDCWETRLARPTFPGKQGMSLEGSRGREDSLMVKGKLVDRQEGAGGGQGNVFECRRLEPGIVR